MAKRVYVASKSTADNLKSIVRDLEVKTREVVDQTNRNYNSLVRSFKVELEEDMPAFAAATSKPTPISASVFTYNNTSGEQKQSRKVKVYNVWPNYTMRTGEKMIVNFGPGGVLVPRDPEGMVQMFKLTANFATTDASVAAEVDTLSRSGIAATVTTLYNDLGTFEGSIDDLAQAYYTQGEWVIQQLACPTESTPPDGGGGGGGGDPGGELP